MTRIIAGLEPEKISTNVLQISRGCLYEQIFNSTLEFSTETNIDLTINGINGLDVGSPSNGELYIYVIKVHDAGYGFIASKEKFEDDVICPLGYQVVRKLPWGVIYNTAWDGIPNYHLSYWPLPEIRFTDAESSSLWNAVVAGNATTWTDIDLSPWIPDNARIAKLLIQVRYGQIAGSAYLRSHTGQNTGILVGSVSASCGYQTSTIDIRTTSTRRIQYMCNTSGAKLYVWVLGYSMTEHV